MNQILLVLFFLLSFISRSQNPFDCTNAIIICGNSSIGIEPNGIGFDEFSLPGNNTPSCYTFDQHSIWFRFEILTSGVFTFDIIPDDGADYDFAIFGPNVDCTTLGDAIRCSSTNPEAAGVPADTGLNLKETDVTEGPGFDGNGYLRYLDVLAGEVYYLLVDRAIGSGGFSLFYTGDATLPLNVEANEAPDLSQCDTDGTPDGFTAFNLNSQIPVIQGSQTDVTVTFHLSLNDANIGINELPNPYTNISNPQPIFARIENLEGCAAFTSFTIAIGSPILLLPSDVVLCSETGSETYILDTIIPEVIADPTGYAFSYFSTENDANTNMNALGNSVILTTTAQTIYVRVEEVTDPLCFSVTQFNGFTNVITPATQPTNIVVCDDDFNGFATVDLTEKDVEILGGLPATDFEVRYYISAEDRLADRNRIIGNFTNTENPQIIYASLFEIATECVDFVAFTISVNPKPIPVFNQESYIYCLNATEPLEIGVQAGFENYVWSTGETGPDLNTIFIDAPGTYSVTVTNEFTCETTVEVQVFPSDVATIIDVVINDFSGTDNNITIIVEGPGDYEYALNDENFYQESNVFEGVFNGYYTVYVRDKNGCGVVSKEILVLDYPRFFTPNNDGFHDSWKIIGIEEFPASKMFIYDRFGKLLKQLKPGSNGWDGKNLKGKEMPSSDYWFTLNFENGRSFNGHFTLKR